METGLHPDELKTAAVIIASVPVSEWEGRNEPPVLLADAIRRFHDAMGSVLQLYGWQMSPFTGDKLIAYSFIEGQEEIAAAQAVNIAIEVKSRVEAMVAGQELPGTMGFRASLTAGKAVQMTSGTGKSSQKVLVGNPVELGNRIMDLADPGQILADAEIFRFTNQQYEYQILDPVRLKGQSKPVALYELTGRRKQKKVKSGEPVRMISSEMIGRSMELKMIEDLFKQLLNGKGSVINIEGAAGIGKSRLITEVRELEIVRRVRFLEGRALSEGKNLSFHPIIQIIKSWSGIREEDNLEESLMKLSNAVNAVYPEQEHEIIPFIATMMGYPLEGKAWQRVKGIEGEALEKLILKNVRELISHIADVNAVAFMIEDAHWADQSSVMFMESLFKLAKNHRLLFINVFRPGFNENGERIKDFVKDNLPDHSMLIVLGPLDTRQSLELISNLMNETNLPGDISDLIVSRAEGNPFFIEEVIRSFIDEGMIEVTETGFAITDQIHYANIPETIDKVILSRIERLDEKTKNLLKTASVIGRNFYYKVLEEATQTLKELDSRLEYLTEAQLLSEHRHREDVEFLFKHALAQQATYDSILQKTRKDLHLKIAHSIEKVFANKIQEFYGILALHYGKAEVKDKREEYLVKAGDEAFRSGASNEAMNFYLEAFRSMSPDPKNEHKLEKYMDLEIKIGFAQEAAGNNIEAIESFQRIITKYFGHSFPQSESRNRYRGITSMMIVIFKLYFPSFYFRKAPDEKFDTFMKVVTQWGEAMTSLNPRLFFLQMNYFLKVTTRYDLSRSMPGLSFFVESVSLFMWTGISFKVSKKMIDYARNAGAEGHPSSLLDFRFIKRMYDYHVGNLLEEKDFEEVYQTGMHIGDFWPSTIYVLYCGMVAVAKGAYPDVVNCVRKLEEISESFDNSHARAQSYRLSAYSHSQLGMLDQTIRIADEGIRYTGKTGHFAMLMVIWCAKSIAHSAKNEPEEAKKALLEAEKLVAERKIMTIYFIPYLQAKAHVEFSALRTCLNQHLPYREKSKEVIETVNMLIRQSKKMRSATVEAYRLKAMVLWLLGKQRRAYKYFILSIKAGQNYNSSLELSRTYFEAGKCLRETNSIKNSLMGIIGSEYLLKAKNMFEEMNLHHDLEKYNRYIEA